jgi:hypothetical protein
MNMIRPRTTPRTTAYNLRRLGAGSSWLREEADDEDEDDEEDEDEDEDVGDFRFLVD